MREGILALGGIVFVLGASWWVMVSVDGDQLIARVSGVNGAASAWSVYLVPLAFLIVGATMLLAGVIARSPDERAAM